MFKNNKKETNNDLLFSYHHVSPIAVRDAIDNIKNTTSKVVYEMNIPHFKYLKNTTVAQLTKIMNLCIHESTYTSCFKLTKIIPTFT